jgi:hypothetical protein
MVHPDEMENIILPFYDQYGDRINVTALSAARLLQDNSAEENRGDSSSEPNEPAEHTTENRN